MIGGKASSTACAVTPLLGILGALHAAPAASAQALQELSMFVYGGNPSVVVAIGQPTNETGPRPVMKWSGSGNPVTLTLPSGYVDSSFYRSIGYHQMLSDNGSVVVADALTSAGVARAVRWSGLTPALVPLLSGSTTSNAMGVSADGQVVFGLTDGPTGMRGFRWVVGQTVANLGALTGFPNTYPEWASSNGTVIVGEAVASTTGQSLAFRWSNGAISALPTPSGHVDAAAWCTSADGGVTVGSCYVDGGSFARRAVRWRNGRSLVIPPLAGMTDSDADLVSDDGGTVVGIADGLDQSGAWVQTAYRWTQLDGLASLAPMETVLTVSSNGAIIVGLVKGVVPYIWTPATGTSVPLSTYLTGLGVNLGGRTLFESGSSRDGTAIGGALRRSNGTLAGYAILGMSLPGTGAPTAPLNISATDGTLATGVSITWSASAGATGYRVMRSLAGGTPTQIASIGAVTTYLDATASPGVTYEYSVRAAKGTQLSTIGGADDGRRAGTACVGDLNDDQAVNGDDLGLLLNAWGAAPSGTPADLNQDGAVNGDDLGLLLARWGACPA